jgi:predicted PurR-regulated permease PerM
MTPEISRFGRQVFIAILIIGLIAAAAYAIDLILLVFAGILLAVLLRGAGTWLAGHSGLSMKWSMAIALIAFAAVVFGSIWMFGVQIANQADQLVAAVSQAYGQLHEKLQQYRMADFLMSGVGSTALAAPAKAASGILWVVASMVLILFLGLYFSTSPELYTELFLSFFSGRRRGRMAKLLNASCSALRWWLAGQFISMGIVGIITITGLLIIGAPMAVALGVLAALLTFIPYVGPIVSAVPGILIGFTRGGKMALYVMLVYLIAHVVEGYIVTPFIQHRLVYLPPALILATQFLMELFAGTVGVMLATPLMVIAMVLIKQLYFGQEWTDEVTDAA